MRLVARTPTLMSINNSLSTKVPVGQAFSGRNRLKSHSSHRIRRKLAAHFKRPYRLSVRIPKTEPTSAVPVAQEESQ